MNAMPYTEIQLTAEDLAVYAFIEEFYSLNGYAPGVRDIQKRLHYASSDTVSHHIARLHRAGWLSKQHNVHRSIVPVHYPRVHYRTKNPSA